MNHTKTLKIMCACVAAVLLIGGISLYYLSTKKGSIETKMDVTECEHILEEAGTPPDILEKIDPGFKQYLGKKMQNKKESFQYYGQEIPFTEDGEGKLDIFTTKPQVDYGRERARIYIYFNWDKSGFFLSDDVSFKFNLFNGWELRDTPEFLVDTYNNKGEIMASDRYMLFDLSSNLCEFRGDSMSAGKRSFNGFTNISVEKIAETDAAMTVQFTHNGTLMANTVAWKGDVETGYNES